MSANFSEENLIEAFCRIVAATGFGEFENDCKAYLDKIILVTIPENLQTNFPEKLLQSAILICTKSPYSWQVNNAEPSIDANTTFNN